MIKNVGESVLNGRAQKGTYTTLSKEYTVRVCRNSGGLTGSSFVIGMDKIT